MPGNLHEHRDSARPVIRTENGLIAFRRIGIIAPAGAVNSIDTAAVPANPADLRFAQRCGRKCQENLGYGRTGSYGCG